MVRWNLLQRRRIGVTVVHLGDILARVGLSVLLVQELFVTLLGLAVVARLSNVSVNLLPLPEVFVHKVNAAP